MITINDVIKAHSYYQYFTRLMFTTDLLPEAIIATTVGYYELKDLDITSLEDSALKGLYEDYIKKATYLHSNFRYKEFGSDDVSWLSEITILDAVEGKNYFDKEVEIIEFEWKIKSFPNIRDEKPLFKTIYTEKTFVNVL